MYTCTHARVYTRRRYRRMLLRPLFVFIFKRAVSFFLPISHPSSEVITARSGSCCNSSRSSNTMYGTRCCTASVVVVVLLIVQMYFLRRTNYIQTDHFIVCFSAGRTTERVVPLENRIINGCSNTINL